MIKTDEILNKPHTGQGAYKVPEGYFDTLNERILSQLPGQSGQRRSVFMRITGGRLWRTVAAAAVVTGIAVAATLKFAGASGTAQHDSTELAAADSYSEEYIDDCMEYAMIESDDVVTYLANL